MFIFDLCKEYFYCEQNNFHGKNLWMYNKKGVSVMIHLERRGEKIYFLILNFLNSTEIRCRDSCRCLATAAPYFLGLSEIACKSSSLVHL